MALYYDTEQDAQREALAYYQGRWEDRRPYFVDLATRAVLDGLTPDKAARVVLYRTGWEHKATELSAAI